MLWILVLLPTFVKSYGHLDKDSLEEESQLQFVLDYDICEGNMTFNQTFGYYHGDPVFVSGSNLIIRCPPWECLADISLFLEEKKEMVSEPMQNAYTCLGKLAIDGRLYDTLKKASLWVKTEWLPPHTSKATPYPFEGDTVHSNANKRHLRAVDVQEQRRTTKKPASKGFEKLTSQLPDIFKKTPEFYQVVLIALSAILGLILILQYFLLMYLLRMRENYVLLSRNAFIEEVYDETLTDTDTDTGTGPQQKSEISSSRLKQLKTDEDNVPSELKSKKDLNELQSGLM